MTEISLDQYYGKYLRTDSVRTIIRDIHDSMSDVGRVNGRRLSIRKEFLWDLMSHGQL